MLQCQTAHLLSSIVGSVVECSPATRAARVRFPDDADFFSPKIFFIKFKICCRSRQDSNLRSQRETDFESVALTTRPQLLHFNIKIKRKGVPKKKIIAGDGGYRSPYLSHAKRALYHLSYVPIHTCKPVLTGPHSDFDFRVEHECPGSSVGRALGF